jgi:hypothetical protein
VAMGGSLPGYLKDVERYAVIGDARWQERLT